MTKILSALIDRCVGSVEIHAISVIILTADTVTGVGVLSGTVSHEADLRTRQTKVANSVGLVILCHGTPSTAVTG